MVVAAALALCAIASSILALLFWLGWIPINPAARGAIASALLVTSIVDLFVASRFAAQQRRR